MQDPLDVGRNRKLRRQLKAIERFKNILVPQDWVGGLRPAGADAEQIRVFLNGTPGETGGEVPVELPSLGPAAAPEHHDVVLQEVVGVERNAMRGRRSVLLG